MFHMIIEEIRTTQEFCYLGSIVGSGEGIDRHSS